MSFCQKHHNHHCIHAHNCKNPAHKSKNVHKSQRNLRTTTISYKKNLDHIAEENEECDFDGGREIIPSVNEMYLKKIIDEKDAEMQEQKRMNLDANKKIQKLSQANRHMESQIEYYRQQFEALIRNNTEDVRNQIKRHLKQNSQLNIKIKFLKGQLGDWEDRSEKLEEEVKRLSRMLSVEGRDKQRLEQDYNKLIKRMKKLSNENSIAQSSTVEKQKNQLQEKYRIVKEETNVMINKHKREIAKLNEKNSQNQEQITLLQNKLKQQKKLLMIDVNELKKRQAMLLQKVEELQARIRQMKNEKEGMSRQIRQKEEELKYAKKTLQKQMNNEKQNRKLISNLNELQTKHQKQEQMEEEAKENINEEHQLIIGRLKDQIRSLNKKIQVLESKKEVKNEIIEEYMLTVGASQAFKKIVEEKNEVIKRLIREKGELLRKG